MPVKPLFTLLNGGSEFLREESATWPIDPGATPEQNVSSLRALVDDLTDTAAQLPNCGGLAAVQIGVLARVFIFRVGGKLIPAVNPRVISRSTEVKNMREQCLSIPDKQELGGLVSYDVRRAKWVNVEFEDADGHTESLVLSKIEGRSFLHELDHLNGKLICDRRKT